MARPRQLDNPLVAFEAADLLIGNDGTIVQS